MTTFHKCLSLAGLLTGVLCLPQVSFAVNGCTNTILTGYYNTQVTNANASNLLTASTFNPGIVNSSSSLSGAIPGLGRFFFDGNGNIIGQTTAAFPAGTKVNIVIGTYSVATNCTATMSLTTGQTFNMVIGNGGLHAVFVETDAAGGGTGGTLDQSSESCIGSVSPQSFAFSYFGTLPPTTASSGGSTTVVPNSTVGQITLDGVGGFTLTGSQWALGAVQQITASGTYTLNTNCAVNLTFNSPPPGTFVYSPTIFEGQLLNSASGSIVVQSSGNTATGLILSQ